MKPVRAGLVLAVLVLAACAAAVSARGAVHTKVTRARAVRRLGRMLGARPERVRLVFGDENTRDVVLEWTGYAPHAAGNVLSSSSGAGTCSRGGSGS